jgi:acetyl esterase/lipase
VEERRPRPARTSDHLIVLPGGGYEYHAAHEAEPVAAWLSESGLSSSVFRYPVGVRHPAPLEAVRAEIRRWRARGAKRVGLLGFSAGGHAAGMAALAPGAAEEERVDLAVLCYPVVSMQLSTHAGSRYQLLGPDAPAELRAATSLDRLVTENAPPVFIWHTAADDLVPVQHSYLLASALAEQSVPHALHVFTEGGHGLGLAAVGTDGDASRWRELCVAWLAERGWIER